MAKADYICCDVCDNKVIYDGSWEIRDGWSPEEWATVICETCTLRNKESIAEFLRSLKAKQ